ncbi:SCP2 sterol-binding domain-containing protein [Aliiroseovarius lamellibrachiae]|uniref:SCP2 sterol-binding domain-containing protein n=1 Tax=Aliiroseovarius lamellibrachiae TaxID=1924933 RepID=UPI001BDFD643|nr:SCP2 sterol-binding domain-containing protein [Aliiroseovarius lamellibrachiae]MBT2131825.1 SCP2 sterol-binding domain-containing protein [Aliiroseovarius lamellibrachiae]
MPLTDIAAKISRGLAKHPLDESLKLDCGEDGVIALVDGAVSRENVDTKCTVAMSKDNLEKLMRGKLNPMTAFMTGKIKVDGDVSIAMKLGKLFKG